MAFDTETGKEAGKKSKRGQDTQLKELRECYSEILENNKGNIQEWIDKVAETDPAKALELILKLELKQNIVEQEPTQITFFKTYDNE